MHHNQNQFGSKDESVVPQTENTLSKLNQAQSSQSHSRHGRSLLHNSTPLYDKKP